MRTTRRGGVRGYDAGKKIVGRKRHLLVDTDGLILKVRVHAANVQDRDGATLVLDQIDAPLSQLELIWADGGYAGDKLADWMAERFGPRPLRLEKSPAQRRAKRLCRPAPALGGRTHLRLAQQLPPPEQ